MILVALKKNVVVAIEQNGEIDTSVDHDLVVSVPETSNPSLGWEYCAPRSPTPPVGYIYFFSPTPIEDQNPRALEVYVDDGNGNPVLVTEPTE